MDTILGLLGLVLFIVSIVSLAAAVTWLIVKITPSEPRTNSDASSA
jgi:hypothetical protein